MASVFKSMQPSKVDLDMALKLLTIPRELGPHPDDGEPVFAKNGPHGPYVNWGKENRSIETEDALLTITLDEAVAELRKPRQRRGAKPPLKELGADPATGKDIVVKDGRFGMYMTDGETNVSFRTAETLDNITLEHAADRLAEKRAKGPAPTKARATKKPAAKKKPATKKK
jgi:DNA topoisomerase-1